MAINLNLIKLKYIFDFIRVCFMEMEQKPVSINYVYIISHNVVTSMNCIFFPTLVSVFKYT